MGGWLVRRSGNRVDISGLSGCSCLSGTRTLRQTTSGREEEKKKKKLLGNFSSLQCARTTEAHPLWVAGWIEREVNFFLPQTNTGKSFLSFTLATYITTGERKEEEGLAHTKSHPPSSFFSTPLVFLFFFYFIIFFFFFVHFLFFSPYSLELFFSPASLSSSFTHLPKFSPLFFHEKYFYV